MGDEPTQAVDVVEPEGVDAHRDARSLIRLLQCPRCSYPIKQPMTLPCGNSVCRSCLPQLHLREHISYPDLPSRLEGFQCPFPSCAVEHPLADCSADVTLSKVMTVVENVIGRYRPVTSDTPLLLEEGRIRDGDERPQPTPRSRVLHGGRIVATYTFAEMGELAYDAEVSYQTVGDAQDDYHYLDVALLENLRETTGPELDCQICYNILLDPLTTSCGHTFCRKCLHRVLDHSSLCPICRRELLISPSLQSGNHRLGDLLNALCAEALTARAEAVAKEETGAGESLDTPLFVCTLSYPSMPTFLHIFEPRYRLMIRRAVENGNRKFGMVLYNHSGEPQGALGTTQFMEYGTLLHVLNMEVLSDGRSLIETIGVSRFKVKDWGLRDGYIVAKVERVEDISLAEEERIEAMETTNVTTPPHDLLGQLDQLSTRALLQIGSNFVAKMRAASAPWLHERVLAAYGNPPDDPALFPFWLATLLPIQDQEKYKLLPVTSVRERLKITARWIRRIEAQRW
ncbi:MAG: hypothetical protein M1816_007008 [Peltula sp. TS41687]|nr:MAG: hypothetical protein M1816_007008 [Peltula sp. TS41687]